jgi:cyanophycinase
MLDRSGGGDVVVIRATGSDGYNSYLYNLATVNSVETLIIDSRRKADDPAIEQTIRQAEALFIAGGNQDDYVSYWKGTKVESALNYLATTKKVPIGGTSAGLAILGQYYYSASAGTVYSHEALADPYNRYMAGLGGSFLQMPFMANTITDSHYNERDRQGRHFVFMARLVQDFGVGATAVRGIGVDERTAACVDEQGIARVFGSGQVYFLQGWGGAPEICQSATPLSWNRNQQAVKAYLVQGTSSGTHSFSLANWSSGSGGSWQYWWAERGDFQRQ